MPFHFSRMYEDTQQTKRSYHKLCHRSSANGEWRSSLKLLTGIPANEETSDAPFHIDSHPSHGDSAVQRLPVVQESSIIRRSKKRVNAQEKKTEGD